MTSPDVDAYVASLPAHVQPVVAEIRRRIHAALPEAGEKLSYQIAGFTLNGKTVVHVGGWKAHVSVYPVPDAGPELREQLEPYLEGRGTLKFPLREPVPYELIAQLVALLAAQRDKLADPAGQYPYPPPELLVDFVDGAGAGAAPLTVTSCQTPPDALTPLPLASPGLESPL